MSNGAGGYTPLIQLLGEIGKAWDAKATVAALAMVYVGLDTMALLACPVGQQSQTRSDFIAWVDRYLVTDPELKRRVDSRIQSLFFTADQQIDRLRRAKCPLQRAQPKNILNVDHLIPVDAANVGPACHRPIRMIRIIVALIEDIVCPAIDLPLIVIRYVSLPKAGVLSSGFDTVPCGLPR